MSKPTKETLLEQERFELKPKSGGGLLSYEVWGHVEKDKTVVTRYNLAYINHTKLSYPRQSRGFISVGPSKGQANT